MTNLWMGLLNALGEGTVAVWEWFVENAATPTLVTILAGLITHRIVSSYTARNERLKELRYIRSSYMESLEDAFSAVIPPILRMDAYLDFRLGTVPFKPKHVKG